MAARTRRAILALALGSASLGAATTEDAPPPQLTEVSREEASGVSLRVLTLPIDAERARRESYFAHRQLIDAFKRMHLTPGWSPSHGADWIGQGLDPYRVVAAVAPGKSAYFAAKVAAGPDDRLELAGPKDQPHLRICEVRFNPTTFPRGARLATAYLLQMIVMRDGCSLKGLGDPALQAEMRTPIDFKGYEAAEQKAFPGGRRVSVVEYRGRERLSWPRAAAFVLGDARLAQIAELPAGVKAIGMVRQTSGATTFVLHSGVFGIGTGDQSVCVFQGFPWPRPPMPEYSRTWPLPESEDPAVSYCLAARKRSDERYLKALREAAEKNPPRIRVVPVP